MTQAQARAEIVRYCRQLWERRLVSGTSGNVSVRLDGGELLVTPSQRSLASLQPADLVLLHSNGTPVDDAQRATSELPLHLSAYAVRPDITCVVHTHPTMTVVYSQTGRLFPRDTVGASESLGTASWTPYRKNGTQELADVCAAEFARTIDVVVMERHGLCVIARSLEEAFVQTDLAEEASRIAYYSALLPH